MHDLIVVGAGPAGCRLATRAAEAGLETLLLEEHPEVGSPVHCTGIVGEAMLRRYPLPRHVLAGPLPPFQVLSPSGRRYTLPPVGAWLLNRGELDRHLADQALSAGAELRVGTRAEEVREVGQHVDVRAGGRLLRARAVVLATGAMTNLPSRSGLGSPPAFHQAAQVHARLEGPAGVELRVGRRLAPGSFAYAVCAGGPPSRLGVLARTGAWSFLARLLGDLREAGRLGDLAGPPVCRRIPMGPSPRTVRGRVLSVGDAAGQAKTTTGGGILFGMVCADLLAEVLVEARRDGDFLPERLRRYDRAWKQHLQGELRLGTRLRRILEHAEDSDLEELVALLGRDEVLRVLVREGDFDSHRGLMAGLARLGPVRDAALALAGRRVPGAGLLGTLYATLDRQARMISRKELRR